MQQVKILYQPLKAKWYRMIEAGVKIEEYREITPYWMKRLMVCYGAYDCDKVRCTGPAFPWRGTPCHTNNKTIPTYYTHVQFSLGYPKKDDATRRMTFELKGIECREGREELGAEKGKKYLVEVLGRRTTLDGTKLWEG